MLSTRITRKGAKRLEALFVLLRVMRVDYLFFFFDCSLV